MDRFFVERIEDGFYRIAMVDRYKIFNSNNPEKLSIPYDSPEINPSKEDREQIFFAIGQTINGIDFFLDLYDTNVSCKLNTWTVSTVHNSDNSVYLLPLTRTDRILLYSQVHSITPTEEELSVPLHFNLPTNSQLWKTGILQRCFRCLLLEEYKNNGRIYALLDEQYRRIMRWKLETEGDNNNVLVSIIRDITSLLGLNHTRDTKPFNNIPSEIDALCEDFSEMVNKNLDLRKILNLWIDSELIQEDGYYKLRINPDITEVLSCMMPILSRPKRLEIIEAIL